jgi:hypothetical protein
MRADAVVILTDFCPVAQYVQIRWRFRWDPK